MLVNGAGNVLVDEGVVRLQLRQDIVHVVLPKSLQLQISADCGCVSPETRPVQHSERLVIEMVGDFVELGQAQVIEAAERHVQQCPLPIIPVSISRKGSCGDHDIPAWRDSVREGFEGFIGLCFMAMEASDPLMNFAFAVAFPHVIRQRHIVSPPR